MRVICFGIIKDVIGNAEIEVDTKGGMTVADLKAFMYEKFHGLHEYKSFMVSVNQEYATDDLALHSTDEIALIPPVSGG